MQKILDFVNKKVSKNVTYKESVLNILIVFAVFGLIGISGYTLFIKFEKFFLNNIVWLVCSSIIYAVCMAGVVYNIIHGVPFTNIDKKGNFEWFHSGQRSQFGAEGLIMSIAISVSGTCFVLVVVVSRKMESVFKKKVIVLSLLALGFVLIKFIENIYQQKSGGYTLQFWPPAHYVKGPIINDKGNSL